MPYRKISRPHWSELPHSKIDEDELYEMKMKGERVRNGCIKILNNLYPKK